MTDRKPNDAITQELGSPQESAPIITPEMAEENWLKEKSAYNALRKRAGSAARKYKECAKGLPGRGKGGLCRGRFRQIKHRLISRALIRELGLQSVCFYLRSKIREDGFFRRIFPPILAAQKEA